MRYLILLFALRLSALDGVVTGVGGQPVARCRITLETPQGAVLTQTTTDAEGRFQLAPPNAAGLFLRLEAAGFASYTLRLPNEGPLRIELTRPTSVNVTAQRGMVEAEGESINAVATRDDLASRPVQTIAQLLEGAPNVVIQQTSTAQASPFLRGLTGYQVLNLLDGVRFNNSTFRSGPNQYLAWVEPSQASRIEAVLGPASAQYGSDALGGAIQVLTPPVDYDSGIHGDFRLFGASADLSAGVAANLMLGQPRFAWLLGGSARRHDDLRPGGGVDSRNVLRRLLGFNPDQIRAAGYDGQPGTGFSQTGAQTKLAFRPTANQSLTAWYQHSAQTGVQNYKDLAGGLGRLTFDLTPQQLQFGYLRYERIAWGWLDSLSGTFSVNAQRDGVRRRNLRLADPFTVEENRVISRGYAGQASTHRGHWQALVFGGELYDEGITARRQVNNVSTRPLFPNGQTYRTGGAFLQDQVQWRGWRLQGALRFTRIASNTTSSAGFGVANSSQTFADTSWNLALSRPIAKGLSLHAIVSKGFRAPNANDLGAVGLNDLGYEIPAAEAVPAGALLGASAGEGALSLGRPITTLAPERLHNYEAGWRWQGTRWQARAQFFSAHLADPIVRRTLLFPNASVPTQLAGQAVSRITPTAAQAAQGVVAVATSIDPRAVKAFVNDGRARYQGVESSFRWNWNWRWTTSAHYSWITGRDLDPNRNIRRLPPQQGGVTLRYHGGRRWWIEGAGLAMGAQRRLNGGDLDDERIGASRARADIASFFAGTRAEALRDGDRLRATGETLAQIQDRVVGTTTARVPLFTSTAGWLRLDLRGGRDFGEHWHLMTALENLLDRNYRVHGSGMDAAGVNAYVSLQFRW